MNDEDREYEIDWKAVIKSMKRFNNPYIGFHAIPIADIACIDVCELMAIEHGLIDIIQRHTTYNITFKPCSNWSNQNRVPTTNTFNTIRIISDSKTSLNWIAGSYRIKEKRIYDIVQRIGDTMCYINQHMDVDIRMQWTKAHVQTVGNELADELAKEAVELINEQWMPYNTF
eukprot:1076653_1